MRRARRLLTAALLTLPFAFGCTPLVRRHPGPPPPLDPPAEGSPLRDYRGAWHVHTELSHDSGGTLEELCQAANAVGIHFVVVSDHNARRTSESDPETGVTLLHGVEYSTDRGHVVALGDRELHPAHRDSEKLVAAIGSQGGLSIVAHPFWRSDSWRWSDREELITHLEVANLAVDIAEDIGAALFRLPFYLIDSTRALSGLLDRPTAELQLWDRLLAERPVFALGACDAHSRWYIGYETALPLLTTHVLAESKAAADLISAIRNGRCYVAWDVFGTTDGFRYCVENGSGRTEMGGETTWDEATRLRVHVPADARIEVRRNGVPFALATARRWSLPLPGPGTYRLEVYRNETLWILSNPIFVR